MTEETEPLVSITVNVYPGGKLAVDSTVDRYEAPALLRELADLIETTATE